MQKSLQKLIPFYGHYYFYSFYTISKVIEGGCGFTTLGTFEFVLINKLRREKAMDEDGVITEHLDVKNNGKL